MQNVSLLDDLYSYNFTDVERRHLNDARNGLSYVSDLGVIISIAHQRRKLDFIIDNALLFIRHKRTRKLLERLQAQYRDWKSQH